MTILTKPSNEKKSEKVPLPMGMVVSDGQPLPSAPLAPLNGEPDTESMVFNRRHISASTTIFLFLSALAVMLVGILGGVAIYRMYAPAQRSLHYRTMCDFPLYPRQNMSIARLYAHPELIEMSLLHNLFPAINETAPTTMNDMPGDGFFREEIELDLTDDESFSKIDVPDFKDGRRGRFMHDFKEDQSAIIDTTTNRCFVMALDRETTLPPRNFYDLMQKMGAGYYNIDTDRIRKNMRVVTPELTDMTLISQRIANECYDMKVYLLEKYIPGVFKREARLLSDSGKFAEFSGKKIVEFNLMNIDDIENYEAKQKM